MSRLIILTAAALCCATAGLAQAKGDAAQKNNTSTTASDVKMRPFKIVEQMPAFNGDMNAFLNKELRYPDSARAHNVEGRCAIRFIVAETGSVTDVQLMRSSGNVYLDSEAVRVVKAMPPWKPGRQSGKIVSVYYTLPINFKLED